MVLKNLIDNKKIVANPTVTDEEMKATWCKGIGQWAVDKITDMSKTFYWITDFNQDLSGWNTAEVTTMQNMFAVRAPKKNS